MVMEKKKFDLEDRLVEFACMCLRVCLILPNTPAGKNLGDQLSRSGTAAALNYGEAQAGESRADFIHKCKVVLKEIRETRVNLKIITRLPVIIDPKVEIAFKESNELIGIFLTSIATAKKNNERLKV
jgi:four helix bundle protein